MPTGLPCASIEQLVYAAQQSTIQQDYPPFSQTKLDPMSQKCFPAILAKRITSQDTEDPGDFLSALLGFPGGNFSLFWSPAGYSDRRDSLATPCYLVLGLLVLGLLLLASGCQPPTVTKLRGKWMGRPDSAAARALREDAKFGDKVAQETSVTVFDRKDSKTDWEKFAVAVIWDFVSREELKMSLEDGSQALTGYWEIIGSSPIGCTIEVTTGSPENSGENPGDETKVRRRFEIELDERNGECVGFLLSESGADRQMGTLFFSRPAKIK